MVGGGHRGSGGGPRYRGQRMSSRELTAWPGCNSSACARPIPTGSRRSTGSIRTVSDGEFIVIVGPSGCGKSTLLRMVAGLERVTEGEIRIGDTAGQRPGARRPEHRHGFPELCALSAHERVRQHGLRAPQPPHRPKDEIDRRVAEASRILQLDGMLDRRPNQLSGGQRQRVAMGRAIVREPDVFLFDEPLSNLDAKLRVQMRLEIKRLQRDLANHQPLRDPRPGGGDDPRGSAHRDERRASPSRSGRRSTCTDEPASVFVAGFIGSPAMNFLPGTVAGRRAGA